jgi:DNA (cytosine-5)-methyltransferase 1
LIFRRYDIRMYIDSETHGRLIGFMGYFQQGGQWRLRSIEICAGAGGQALGLEQAGFEPLALVETDADACATLRLNRPGWNVLEGDLREFDASELADVDLLAGGVPCPPFTVAGKQLGSKDNRDLFPEAMRLVSECLPRAVMLENVPGLLQQKFDRYRRMVVIRLEAMGYSCFWDVARASRFSVPQLRPRSVLIALRHPPARFFTWPEGSDSPPPQVGPVLFSEMASLGWAGARKWAEEARGVAPTLVGGSKKHGGADLGPTRAKSAWEKLGVDGKGVADEPPGKNFVGKPRLTVKMAALVQGFPPEWTFVGKKTSAYRQVGNAFPPPLARAMGEAVRKALEAGELSGA